MQISRKIVSSFATTIPTDILNLLGIKKRRNWLVVQVLCFHWWEKQVRRLRGHGAGYDKSE